MLLALFYAPLGVCSSCSVFGEEVCAVDDRNRVHRFDERSRIITDVRFRWEHWLIMVKSNEREVRALNDLVGRMSVHATDHLEKADSRQLKDRNRNNVGFERPPVSSLELRQDFNAIGECLGSNAERCSLLLESPDSFPDRDPEKLACLTHPISREPFMKSPLHLHTVRDKLVVENNERSRDSRR